MGGRGSPGPGAARWRATHRSRAAGRRRPAPRPCAPRPRTRPRTARRPTRLARPPPPARPEPYPASVGLASGAGRALWGSVRARTARSARRAAACRPPRRAPALSVLAGCAPPPGATAQRARKLQDCRTCPALALPLSMHQRASQGCLSAAAGGRAWRPVSLRASQLTSTPPETKTGSHAPQRRRRHAAPGARGHAADAQGSTAHRSAHAPAGKTSALPARRGACTADRRCGRDSAGGHRRAPAPPTTFPIADSHVAIGKHRARRHVPCRSGTLQGGREGGLRPCWRGAPGASTCRRSRMPCAHCSPTELATAYSPVQFAGTSSRSGDTFGRPASRLPAANSQPASRCTHTSWNCVW